MKKLVLICSFYELYKEARMLAIFHHENSTSSSSNIYSARKEKKGVAREQEGGQRTTLTSQRTFREKRKRFVTSFTDRREGADASLKFGRVGIYIGRWPKWGW
nr:hypothetical protein Iba_scaffold41914CG0010 [Ipomoea batatas]GME10414.1 hypothetical protein Iba_scaffold10073CG0290 [Ipomoea batatas]GME12053.1 hypothetical protein Iba_scaffold13217CG0020 [Ipomoea batatas]